MHADDKRAFTWPLIDMVKSKGSVTINNDFGIDRLKIEVDETFETFVWSAKYFHTEIAFSAEVLGEEGERTFLGEVT